MENQQTQTPVTVTTPAQGAWAKMPSIGTLFSETWNQFAKHFQLYVGIMAIPVLLMIGLMFATFGSSFLTEKVPTLPTGYTAGTGIILIVGFIVIFIMSIWSGAAFTYTVTRPDENITFTSAFRHGWSVFGSYLWIVILSVILFFGGYGLFIIPSIIFYTWFMFAQFALMSEGDRGFQALLKSREYVRGYWWSIFGRLLLFVLAILGISILLSLVSEISNARVVFQLIGFAFQIAYSAFMMVYTFRIYAQLKAMKGPAVLGPQSVKDKKLIIGLTIAGYVVGIALFVLLIVGIAVLSQLGK